MDRGWWTNKLVWKSSSNSPGAKQAPMDEEGVFSVWKSRIAGKWQKAFERPGTDGPVQTHWWVYNSSPYKLEYFTKSLRNDHVFILIFFSLFILLHTGPLEIFHSAMLKYLPKRQGFSFQGMRERGHLACLEHNENFVKRKQATTKTGV